MQNLMKKGLKKKKNDLIEIDSKYYETEKKSNEDLAETVKKLNNEQKIVESIKQKFSI